MPDFREEKRSLWRTFSSLFLNIIICCRIRHAPYSPEKGGFSGGSRSCKGDCRLPEGAFCQLSQEGIAFS
ncbi:hypothetical protein DWY69_02520 [Eisenbergiella massiliensis]|uniref:Uncharacterized protein n=1 Tax=Eisenbergiella massiliensis TaxID=1720294 RepID=A0A3E3J3S5_9FIRM|nr:hypothetical protein DXC51_03820 [Eisenbergiella massiliensis]RGE73984.1 hypothetical protein DWY69_02520 [Eisenbergiella massiliensis]